MKPTLAYSELTGHVYVIFGKDKEDVTKLFHEISKRIKKNKCNCSNQKIGQDYCDNTCVDTDQFS